MATPALTTHLTTLANSDHTTYLPVDVPYLWQGPEKIQFNKLRPIDKSAYKAFSSSIRNNMPHESGTFIMRAFRQHMTTPRKALWLQRQHSRNAARKAAARAARANAAAA